ncbi:AAA family ATPase [Actinokineospora cianjurensis]|uniref:Putative kinase n=1 Tax=Actinokineospora cianjurensis TaxID=585224 RepID=A0A421B5I9_9PSEU|nr:ATP-binding protein [Actinokineospora cianjurensis]RLK59671.1 putative kinase [Actinokineospora cianjurensis]
MAERESLVYLLAGLPGSGKTTYARALERRGVTRVSVDERVIARHGLLGKDYSESAHLSLLRPVLDEVQRLLVELIEQRQPVVLDHGLGTKAERDAYKRLVTDHGGRWRLVCFPVDRAELLRRLAIRNAEAESGVITPETLDWIARQSEEPHDEGEELPDATVLLS